MVGNTPTDNKGTVYGGKRNQRQKTRVGQVSIRIGKSSKVKNDKIQDMKERMKANKKIFGEVCKTKEDEKIILKQEYTDSQKKLIEETEKGRGIQNCEDRLDNR